MAELGAGSGSGYPGALDTNATVEVDSPASGKTKARADVPNDLAASIIAVQTELGTDPAGSLTDVKTYLQTEHGADGTHTAASTTTSGVVELATNAETIAGTDTARATTSAALLALFASAHPIGETAADTGKFTSLELATGATITGIADEDSMSSDSATLGVTQQSVKAYVDANSGLIEQYVYASTSTTVSTTDAVTIDNTIPQYSEMTAIETVAITPTNSSNRLLFIGMTPLSTSAASQIHQIALFSGTGPNALKSEIAHSGGGDVNTITIFHEMAAGTTSEVTFSMMGMGSAAATNYYGSRQGTEYHSTTNGPVLMVIELRT